MYIYESNKECRNKKSVTVHVTKFCTSLIPLTLEFYTIMLQNSCELRVIIVHELARSKIKSWQSFSITPYTLRENMESVKQGIL